MKKFLTLIVTLIMMLAGAALAESAPCGFLNVDSSRSAWMQTGTRYFRGARRNIDGYRMSHNGDEMSDLFYDLSKIYDNRRPSVGDLN